MATPKTGSNDKGFLSKLEVLSAGRDLTPWLKSLGLSSGAISHTLKEGKPGTDLLRALARTERVSLRWLEEGRGAPYMVLRTADDAEAQECLEELLAEDWDGVVLATADDQTFAVILHQPGEYEFKSKRVGYTIVEVVAGNVTLETVRWLAVRGRGLWLLRLTPEDMRRLSRGYMGNIELLGFDDPRKRSAGLAAKRQRLLDQVQSTLHDSPYAVLASPQQGVQEERKEALSYEEALLVEKYRQLKPNDQRHAQAVIRAFADKGDCGTDLEQKEG